MSLRRPRRPAPLLGALPAPGPRSPRADRSRRRLPEALEVAEPVEAPDAAAGRDTFEFSPVCFEDSTRDRREDEGPDGANEARVGEPGVDASELRAMPPLVRARHLLALLAGGRADAPRSARLAAASDLVVGLGRPDPVRRLFGDLAETCRVADIYPLELLAQVLERRPDLLPGYTFGEVVLHKPDLERASFGVDDIIRVPVPLAMRVRGFALEGGGAPGYQLQPGPPGEYHLALGAPGRHALLFMGLIRGERRVDRLDLAISP